MENKKFVVVDTSITNSTEIQNLFNDYNLDVTEPKTSSIRNQINCLNGYKGERTWSIIDNPNKVGCSYSLKHEIIYEAPVYSLNGKELASSYLFYVRLKNLSDSIYLDSLANMHNVSIIGSNKFRPELYVLECNKFSTGNNVELSVLFYETGLFEYAEPDFVILSNPYCSSGCPSDPEFINQWGLENNTPNHTNVDISACNAWEITKGNPNIIVSVIDTGVELAHEDLTCVDPAISWDTHNQTYPSQVITYHGTCCAGIIGAVHNQNGGAGVSPDCTIMSISNDLGLNVLSSMALGDGIIHAYVNGADVLSCSWSAVYSDQLKNAILDALQHGRGGDGCIVVFASGNNYIAPFDFPISMVNTHDDRIIVVGAIDECGMRCVANRHNPHPDGGTACSKWPEYTFRQSNYGTGLSVVAPGVNNYTTDLNNTYNSSFNMTSSATPYVAGIAALILSINPDLSNQEVKDIIEQSAQKIRTDVYNYNTSTTNGMWNEKLGYGLVNAYDALMLTFTNMCNINSHITTGQNITWSEQKYACSNIVVDGTLTIDAPLNFHLDNPQITVNNGGHLIIEDDCNIEVWIDELFTGNIIVNAGGTLEIMSGATLSVFEDGQINILTNSGSNGQLIFNQGATIDLHNDNTLLNIAGNLIIENNAQFTFTGDGYVKFSNPGDDQITNISCGTGSSMLFSGNGQNDKVLEVDQATVRFPAMSSLTFENCKIEMASGSPGRRMLSDGNNPITFNNVKLTSTTGINNSHRSFNFYGQNNITVSNSTFEYGYYGINAIMSYTAGAPMTFNNCTFQNNYYGIKAYSKGIDLIDCIVKDNTSYGLYCTAMSFPSEILISSINYNQSGMYYQGSSSSDIDVSYSNFVGNSSNGIYTSGNFDLDMSCSHIGNNTYGVYTRYGTNLRIDQNARNEITDNTRSIYLNYGLLFANSGYNQLYAANNGYAVYGQTNLIFQPYTVYAHHNRWEYSNPGAAPNYDVNYKLWVYNSPPTPNLTVDIIDNNRGYAICPGLILLPGIQTGGAVVSGANSEENEMLSDIAIQVKALELQSENIESAAGFEGIMEQYCTLIIDADISNNVDTKYWQYIAYSDAHKLVNMLYDKTGQDVENEQLNSLINKLIELNNILSENSEIHYSRYVEYQLDNGLLERFRNNTDEAISLLNQLREELVLTEYTDELANIDTWLCYLENEKLAQQGLLNPDEFMIATENCEQCHSADLSEMELKNSGLSSPSDKDELGDIEQNNVSANTLTIMPNPNNGEFAINVNTNCANCEIIIYNSLGQEVKKYKHNSESGNAIFVSGLNKGQYTVVITEDKQVIDTEKIVVK